jgi:hypothetical protein
MYRFPVYGLALACGLVVGAGCNRTDRANSTGEASREVTPSKNAGMAMARFVSALEAHTGTELYFGDLRLFGSEGAADPTGYKPVPAERRDFVLREATGKPYGVEIEKNSEGLREGKHYTVIAYENEDGKPVLRVTNDDEEAPSAGKAKVRLIHAAPKMEPVALYAPGLKDKLAGESRFSTVSTWQEVDPAKGPFEVRAGDEKTGPRATVPAGAIEAGKLYTFIVEGGPKSAEKLHVVRLEDTPPNTQ